MYLLASIVDNFSVRHKQAEAAVFGCIGVRRSSLEYGPFDLILLIPSFQFPHVHACILCTYNYYYSLKIYTLLQAMAPGIKEETVRVRAVVT